MATMYNPLGCYMYHVVLQYFCFILVAIMCIGQLVGTLVSTISSHYFGRKIAVLASCPPGFMGWILQVNHKISTIYNNLKEACNIIINFQGVGGNLEAILAGRFFVGLSLGMEGSIHSMYICEIVSKRYRGPMVASGVVVINFGFLLVYFLGSFTHWQVRVGSV